MHGLYHSHAERKCRVYCALEQGSSFDWILVLITVKSAGHSVPNHFSQLPREKVSCQARNRWTWKPCPPATTQCLTRHDPTMLRISLRLSTIIIPYTFQNGQDQEDIWITRQVQLRILASLGFAGQDPLTPILHVQFRNPLQTPRLSPRSKCFEYFINYVSFSNCENAFLQTWLFFTNKERYRVSYGLGLPIANPSRGDKFRSCPDWPWGPPSPLFNGYRVSFPEVKRPGRGVNHPPHSSAEVKESAELYI